jgi:hypothetical protein
LDPYEKFLKKTKKLNPIELLFCFTSPPAMNVSKCNELPRTFYYDFGGKHLVSYSWVFANVHLWLSLQKFLFK